MPLPLVDRDALSSFARRSMVLRARASLPTQAGAAPVHVIDRPLTLGEVLAETTRLYGERVWPAVGLGAITAAGIALAALVRNDAAGIAILALAFTVVYATAARLATGDRFREALAQTAVRAPVLLVLAIVVTVPLSIGIFDPIILLFSAFWLGFAGFAVPVAMIERPDGADGWVGRLSHAMTRTLALARSHYLHAVGVVAALLIVYSFLSRLLAVLLAGFAENTGFAAFLLAQVVLAPFFFLGLSVLYFEQRARAVSSRGGRR